MKNRNFNRTVHNRLLGFISAFAAICLSTCMVYAGVLVDLNGSWEFRFEEGKSIAEVAKPDFAATEKMSVPACFDTMPRYLRKRGTALYRRSFTLKAPVSDAKLVIDGMGLTGRFAIDGRDLGTYPYPYARLELKTGPLAAGEHTVFAALDNRFDWDTQKLARPYYDFYCFGGFYHGVSLETAEPRVFVRTRDYRTGLVEVEIEGGGRSLVKVPDFKLWSPEEPNLTTLEVAGRKIRFGIREIKAEKGRLFLNGKPLYLKGVNRHESHPSFGAATPESLMLADIQRLKALGGNFIRGAHYQQSQRFLDLCDEHGVLVWEESLGWGNGSHSKMAACELTNTTFRAQQVYQTREMVKASFNHPSVIIFAFMNEFLSGSKDGKTLADEIITAVKAEDSGRLVTFACSHNAEDISNENTDIIAFNTYPGWIGTDPGTPDELRGIMKERVRSIVKRYRGLYPDKPIIVSEMGTCGVYGQRDPTAAQWTEEFQDEYFGTVIDTVFAEKEICGLTLWQFADASSHYRSGAPVRTKPFAENLAGLFDGYRRPKLVVRTVTEKFRAMTK